MQTTSAAKGGGGAQGSATGTPNASFSPSGPPYLVAVSPAFKAMQLTPNHTVLHDDFNHEIVCCLGNNVQFCPLYAGTSKEINRPLQIPVRDVNHANIESLSLTLADTPQQRIKIESAKRSTRKTYVAIQRSDRDLLFYSLAQTQDDRGNWARSPQRPYAQYSLRAEKRRLCGYHWIDDTLILCITTTTLELWRLGDKRRLKRIAHFSTTVDSYTFIHNRRYAVLVCRNHLPNKLNALKPFRIDTAITKLPKIYLDNPSRPEHSQYGLYRIHAQIHLCLLDTKANKILIYAYHRDAFDRLRNIGGTGGAQAISLPLGESASAMSVVDNLLFVHSARGRQSVGIDTKARDAQCAVFPPTSIGMRAFTPAEEKKEADEAARPADASGILLATSAPANLYDSVVHLGTDLILHLPSARVLKVQLNMPALSALFEDRVQRIEFLLRHRNARPLIVETIREMLRLKAPISAVASVFNQLNDGYTISIRDLRARKIPLGPAPTPNGLSNVNSQLSFAGMEGVGFDEASPFSESEVSRSPRDFTTPRTLSPATSATTTTTEVPTFSRTDNGSPRREDDSSLVASFVGSMGDRLLSAGVVSEPPTPVCHVRNLSSSAAGGDEVINVFPAPADAPRFSGVYHSISDHSDWMTLEGFQVIQQIDVYKEVFFQLHEEKVCPPAYFSASFMEYVRSLAAHGVPLQDFMHRFMIDILIYAEPPQYHILHQYLQYHVIEDHVPIAFQLLKFESRYPPSFQLALDMLSRLKKYDEIVEVLLSCDMLIKAVEIMIQYKVKKVAPRHVLEKALGSGNEELFYTVFTLLQQYNTATHGKPEFRDEDKCEEYVRKFTELFGPPGAQSGEPPSPALLLAMGGGATADASEALRF